MLGVAQRVGYVHGEDFDATGSITAVGEDDYGVFRAMLRSRDSDGPLLGTVVTRSQ
jgi:hypothetical protein